MFMGARGDASQSIERPSAVAGGGRRGLECTAVLPVCRTSRTARRFPTASSSRSLNYAFHGSGASTRALTITVVSSTGQSIVHYLICKQISINDRCVGRHRLATLAPRRAPIASWRLASVRTSTFRSSGLEILGQTDKIQEGAVGLHADQQVEVACRTVDATRDRSEHAHAAGAVSCANVDNRVALLLEVLGSVPRDIVDRRHYGASPSCAVRRLTETTCFGEAVAGPRAVRILGRREVPEDRI